MVKDQDSIFPNGRFQPPNKEPANRANVNLHTNAFGCRERRFLCFASYHHRESMNFL